MIASILTANGMDISVLIEVLEQTESIGMTTIEIRCDSNRTVAWHHPSDYQLDLQKGLWILVADVGWLLYIYIVPHSVFQVPKNSSNSYHAQGNEQQLLIMLLIAYGVEISQDWFLRQGWMLVSKYLMIFSHCIVQFCEFGFHFGFQPDLLINEINIVVSFLNPF